MLRNILAGQQEGDGLRLALIQPEIPQNVGAALRLCACLGVGVDLVGPFGFVLSDRRLRRAGMDYIELADTRRYSVWTAFAAATPARKLLLTTAGDRSLYGFAFRADDVVMVGSESAGAPECAHTAAAARLRLPMRAGARSFNVALAAALALGEALRQTGGLPDDGEERA